MKKVQKLLTALTAAALLAVGFGTAASAETLAYPIKVYGDDKSGAAMNQGTWDQSTPPATMCISKSILM